MLKHRGKPSDPNTPPVAPGTASSFSTTDSQSANGTSSAKEPQAAKNLVELNPDYVLRVQYPNDSKTGKIDLEAVTHVKIILKLLYSAGFLVEVRPDTNDQFILLFVSSREDALHQLVDISNSTDELFGVRANPVSDEKLSLAERLRLVSLKLALPESKGGCGLKTGVHGIKDMFPCRHIKPLEAEYATNWSALGKVFRKSARDEDVRFLVQTCGVAYALYYKFVQAYIASIGCLGLVGVAAWYFLGPLSVLFAAANLFIGLTTYLCIYASEKKSALDWNLHNIEKSEVIKVSDEMLDPEWKVLLRQIMFIPFIVGGAAMLFCAQFACFMLEIFINEIYQGPFQSILALVPTAIVCVAVPVGTAIFSLVASKYIVFENNPTYQGDNKSLLKKLFSFDCLASYAPLTITSFIYLPLGYLLDPYLQTIQAMFSRASSVYTYVPHVQTKQSGYQVNNLRLSSQMFYFMVINQVVVLFVEHALPQILAIIFNIPKVASLLGTPASTKVLDLKALDDPAEHEYLQLVRSKFKLPAAGSLDAEYKQHVIQYGFQMLFGPIWPLGSLICFVFGVIQQEADYLKIIKLNQPPVPARAESSSPWVEFMKILLTIGSFVSIAVTLMYGGRNEIESFVGKSSVVGHWFTVLPCASLSCLVMYVTINLLEKVIDGFYDKAQGEFIEKEKKASSFLDQFKEKRDGHKHDYTAELTRIDELVAVLRK